MESKYTETETGYAKVGGRPCAGAGAMNGLGLRSEVGEDRDRSGYQGQGGGGIEVEKEG